MNQLHSNTDDTSRKRGSHLTLDQRGAIQILNRQGLSLRAIADAVGCAHATVWYELARYAFAYQQPWSDSHIYGKTWPSCLQ